jgi:hypothetical protein
MHQITANENKAKSIIKHETNNTKEMKVEKPKIQKKKKEKKEDKKKGNELLYVFCPWVRTSL